MARCGLMASHSLIQSPKLANDSATFLSPPVFDLQWRFMAHHIINSQ